MRLRRAGLTVLAGALLAGSGRVHAADSDAAMLIAGEERPVTLAPSGRVMMVFAPTNYDATKAWPAIFYYHGLGGRPDTAFLRRLVDDRDYIVVALPYANDDTPLHSKEAREAAAKAERDTYRNAWNWVSAHVRVDEKAVFLAGFSKGGWMASVLWEREAPRLAGMIILLAGRHTGAGAPSAAMQGKPVYLGAGETDPNLIAAIRARKHYQGRGAVVSFDVYSGLGHAVPSDIPRLRTWLRVQGPLRASVVSPDDRAKAAAELAGEARVLLAETDPLRQFRGLQALAEDPRLAWCDPEVVTLARSRFAALCQASPTAEEWQAETKLGELLSAEERPGSLSELKTVRDGYEALAKRYPTTRGGLVAAKHFPLVDEAYQKLSATSASAGATGGAPASGPQRTVTPVFPNSGSGRGSYPVPVRRGNKITFERPSGQSSK